MDLQVLIAFLLYFGFFGWVGWRRGTLRELVVLLTALISWLLLQERGSIFVRFANLGATLASVVASGGLDETGGDPLAALGNAPEVITQQNQGNFLFLLWAILMVLVYAVTNQAIDKGKSNFFAILLGVANGLLFSAILLPRMVAPLLPDVAVTEFVLQANLFDAIRASLDVLRDAFVNVWDTIQPQVSIVILVLITLILLLAASSLRPQKPKKSSNGSSGS